MTYGLDYAPTRDGFTDIHTQFTVVLHVSLVTVCYTPHLISFSKQTSTCGFRGPFQLAFDVTWGFLVTLGR